MQAHEADDEAALLEAIRPPRRRYELTRFSMLRMLGAVYAVHFAALAVQIVPLVGERGLLPVALHLADHRIAGEGPLELPTLFWIDASDAALRGVAWAGVAIASAVALGLTNALAMAALWAIQISFLHVGQTFLGYGWELLLAEAGFLAIFLCPLRTLGPWAVRSPASPVVIGLFRWLTFRVMLGAGLIKMRGDPCWRALRCFEHHFETQPLPSPLSILWHALPEPVLAAGVAFNHFVELVVPFGLFGPRRVRAIAGALTIAFQLALIGSGNLSYLNWLTIAIAIACFDDEQLARLLPARWAARARNPSEPGRLARIVPVVLAIVVGMLSVGPVANMLSPDQVMNTSFDRLHLVNTYGAFGDVSETRYELVIEGTREADPARASWLPYALPCQPGPPERRPCFVAPWQPRLDWQMWFAPMRPIERQPWLVHLVWQLLRGDRDVLSLFAHAPFSAEAPPRWIRIVRWRYRFARLGERVWWHREGPEPWLRPVSENDPALREYVEDFGWTE